MSDKFKLKHSIYNEHGDKYKETEVEILDCLDASELLSCYVDFLLSTGRDIRQIYDGLNSVFDDNYSLYLEHEKQKKENEKYEHIHTIYSNLACELRANKKINAELIKIGKKLYEEMENKDEYLVSVSMHKEKTDDLFSKIAILELSKNQD